MPRDGMRTERSAGGNSSVGAHSQIHGWLRGKRSFPFEASVLGIVRPSGTVPQPSANLTRNLRLTHYRDHVANRSIYPIWINQQQQLLLRSISTNSDSLQRSEISASNSSRSRDPSFKRAYAALTITSHHQPILDYHAMMCSGDKTVLSGMR